MPGLDTTAPSAGGDEFDDLFNYDIDVDEAFREAEERGRGKAHGSEKSKPAGDLGIDEEVQVKATRKPIPKLDEKRLLSERGIPKLRRITKEKLKFKGKGHEFSDIARMLSLYQLWLDELYPRAKFLDSLAMIEKLGHSKSIQVMRKDWINEGKPRDVWHDDKPQPEQVDGSDAGNLSTAKGPGGQASAGHDMLTDDVQRPSDPDSLFLSDGEAESGAPEEDELDALLRAEARSPPAQSARPVQARLQKPSHAAPPAEDELDALLAEHEVEAEKENQVAHGASKPNAASLGAEDFADDMEAMDDLDLW